MMTPARKFMRAGVWCLEFFILIFSALIAGIYRYGTVSDLQKADTIIVLGAAQWNGNPSQIFQARLDRARELYKQGYAASIIVTGGKTMENINSDSSIGKEYLTQRDISANLIFVEEYSRTTLQNLMFAQKIMKARDFRSAILISHDFHMARAERMAQDLGITAFSAPVETQSELSKLRYTIREIGMYGAYLLFHI